MTWDEIALRQGTDKSSAGHGYMDRYEQLLSGRIVNDVLEVGVEKGASLRTWAEIWPLAHIYGVDLDENCANYGGRNTHVIIGDAQDRAAMDVALGEKQFDLIVDDGFHHLAGIVATAETLSGRLRDGGLYVVEDTLLEKRLWPAWTYAVIRQLGERELHTVAVIQGAQELVTLDGAQGRFAMVVLTRSVPSEIRVDVPWPSTFMSWALEPQLRADRPVLRVRLPVKTNQADFHYLLAILGYVPELLDETDDHEEWVFYHPDGPRP